MGQGEPITWTDCRSGLLDLSASFNRPLDAATLESYRTGLGVEAAGDDVRLTCREWRAVVYRLKRDSDRAQFFPSIGELLAALFAFRGERRPEERASRLLAGDPELTCEQRKANQRRWAEIVEMAVRSCEFPPESKQAQQ